MVQILFVDRPEVLEGLRNVLRQHRDRWAMTFVSASSDGCSALERTAFDVVVTDTWVPGTVRESFLDEVRERRPDAIRIVMSAQGGASLRSLPMAHQFVAKPCDPQRLEAAVNQSLLLRSRLTDPAFRAFVGGLAGLPSPSATVVALQQALAERPVDPRRVASIISDDPAISTKVLQVVNSAFFGLPRQLTDPVEAVNYLGAASIAELVMSDEIVRSFRSRSSAADAEIELIRERSQIRADVAYLLAVRAGRPATAAREVWVGAFLADVGHLMLAGASSELREQFEAARLGGVEAVSAATLGGHLISMWGLPHQLVESVALSDEAPHLHWSDGATFTWIARRVVEEGVETPSITAEHLACVGLTPAALLDELSPLVSAS